MIRSGIRIRPNVVIGINLTIDDMIRDGFRAIFMGTGVWRPLRLDIKGESLGNVHYAIDYLQNPGVYRLGNVLTIIGAGNVAVDVARTAVRHGCRRVSIFCHMDESGMAAGAIELSYARIDGVNFELKKLATEIRDDGVIFADTEIITDDDGVRNVQKIEGTEELVASDSVIIAVSQGPRSVIVSSTTGIDVNKSTGLVIVDELGHTTRPGVFAGGDVVTGARSVVEAANVSRRIAAAMDEYVRATYP